MNIAIVSHSYPTVDDPSQGIFIQKEAHLVADFANIEVYLPSVHATPFNKQYYRNFKPVTEPFPVNTFKYFSIPRRKFPQITGKFLSQKVYGNLKESSAKIVHLHALFPSGLTTPYLKKRGYKIVITIHGGDWYTNINNHKMFVLIKKSLNNADAIITVGKNLKNDVLASFPSIEDKTFHIPHGINTKLFSPPNSKDEAKNKLHWDSSKINLLCVGNLFKVKGIDILVKAFYQLDMLQNTHLHIVAPRHHKQAKKNVDDFIKQKSLQNSVTFYPAMPAEQIVIFYQAADLFISPSRKEGFGLAVAEAASCGTPVLATRSGGPEEIVTPEIGFFAEKESIASLKKMIKHAVKKLSDFHPQEMNQVVQSKFGLDEKKKRLKFIYSNL